MENEETLNAPLMPLLPVSWALELRPVKDPLVSLSKGARGLPGAVSDPKMSGVGGIMVASSS
jgi:hypothetical protein